MKKTVIVARVGDGVEAKDLIGPIMAQMCRYPMAVFTDADYPDSWRPTASAVADELTGQATIQPLPQGFWQDGLPSLEVLLRSRIETCVVLKTGIVGDSGMFGSPPGTVDMIRVELPGALVPQWWATFDIHRLRALDV